MTEAVEAAEVLAAAEAEEALGAPVGARLAAQELVRSTGGRGIRPYTLLSSTRPPRGIAATPWSAVAIARSPARASLAAVACHR